MGSAAASWLLLLAAEVTDLTLAVGESSRPRLCAASAGAAPEAVDRERGSSPWDRVRLEQAKQLCRGLARGQVRLARAPAEALAAARRLASEWPQRPEPRVLEARALMRTGDAAGRWAAWQVARGLGFDAAREAGTDPVSAYALRDYAVASVLTGHGEIAGGSYRRLVGLLDAWPDPRHVQRIYLEAALVELRRGPERLGEAAGYLSPAESRASSTGLRAYAAGLRAFVQARRAASGPVAPELDAPEVWHFVAQARAERAPSYWPVVPRHEVYALASLLVERYSLVEAGELWDLYVAGIDPSAVDASVVSFARERQARLARAGGPA